MIPHQNTEGWEDLREEFDNLPYLTFTGVDRVEVGYTDMEVFWDWIKSKLTQARQEAVEECVDKVGRYFYALQSRMILPDPITMQNEIIDSLSQNKVSQLSRKKV
jgi:hypothetical protein